MMWRTLILKNWALLAITLLSVALLLSISHGRALKAEKELAIANLAEYKRLADLTLKTEKTNNDRANDEIRNAIPGMVEQAKTNAYENYKAKYGRGNAACGIRANGLRDVRTSGGSHPDDGAESADATERERLVIEACARDAGRLDLWIERCKLSPKLCQVEE